MKLVHSLLSVALLAVFSAACTESFPSVQISPTARPPSAPVAIRPPSLGGSGDLAGFAVVTNMTNTVSEFSLHRKSWTSRTHLVDEFAVCIGYLDDQLITITPEGGTELSSLKLEPSAGEVFGCSFARVNNTVFASTINKEGTSIYRVNADAGSLVELFPDMAGLSIDTTPALWASNCALPIAVATTDLTTSFVTIMVPRPDCSYLKLQVAGHNPSLGAAFLRDDGPGAHVYVTYRRDLFKTMFMEIAGERIVRQTEIRRNNAEGRVADFLSVHGRNAHIVTFDSDWLSPLGIGGLHVSHWNSNGGWLEEDVNGFYGFVLVGEDKPLFIYATSDGWWQKR